MPKAVVGNTKRPKSELYTGGVNVCEKYVFTPRCEHEPSSYRHIENILSRNGKQFSSTIVKTDTEVQGCKLFEN